VSDTNEITYGSKYWPNDMTALNDVYYNYNYLELEDEGLGLNDNR